MFNFLIFFFEGHGCSKTCIFSFSCLKTLSTYKRLLQTNFRLSQKKLPYLKIKAIFSKIPYFQQFWKLQTKNTLHENYKNMYKNTCFYTGQNLNIVNDYHWQDSTIVLHKNIYIYIFKIIVSKFEFSKCTFYFIHLVLCTC